MRPTLVFNCISYGVIRLSGKKVARDKVARRDVCDKRNRKHLVSLPGKLPTT